MSPDYKFVLNYFCFNSAECNKQQLIKLAMGGKNKPHYSTSLGNSFNYYIKSDPGFKRVIKEIRPDWFVSIPIQIANKKKKLLLDMASKNKTRPTQKTKLGKSLSSYTKKSSKNYDAEFTNKIKKIRPQWLISQTEIANNNKKMLLEMATQDKARPTQKTKLGIRLSEYTKKCSKTYDHKFAAKIKKIRPEWFVGQTEVASQKKKALLKMARSGKDKPYWKSPYGHCINNYTRKSSESFDYDFTKNLKKIRPDWFIRSVA